MTDKSEKEFIYAPFCRADYDLHVGFSSEQKEALSTPHKRSRNYGRSGSLSSLITPLLDIANNSVMWSNKPDTKLTSITEVFSDEKENIYPGV